MNMAITSRVCWETTFLAMMVLRMLVAAATLVGAAQSLRMQDLQCPTYLLPDAEGKTITVEGHYKGDSLPHSLGQHLHFAFLHAPKAGGRSMYVNLVPPRTTRPCSHAIPFPAPEGDQGRFPLLADLAHHTAFGMIVVVVVVVVGSRECTLSSPLHIGDLESLKLKPALDPRHTILTISIGHSVHREVMQQADRLRGCPHVHVVSLVVLRHPVARAASEFYTDVGRNEVGLMGQDAQKRHFGMVGHTLARGRLLDAMRRGRLSLQEYAAWPYPEEALLNDNKVTSMLTSFGNWSDPHAKLLLAKRRLLSYDIVGLQERFPETMAVLNCVVHNLTGHELQYFHHCSNFNAYNQTLSPETVAQLTARNDQDMHLFRLAEQLFEERLRHWRGQPCFQRRFQCPQESERCYRKHQMDTLLGTVDSLKLQDPPPPSGDTICVETCPAV
jgi:hypothetical protein